MTATYIQEANNVSPPGSGGTISLTTASSTAGAGDLSAYAGRWLAFKSSVKTHVRFGGAGVGAATTGDWYLTPDAAEQYRIPDDGTASYVRARAAATAGTLHFRVTSGRF